jgi:hypothetical protein
VSDPKVIDLLIHKSRQDYQETVNFWKQESHVLGPLLNNRDRPHRTFLQKFYEGGFSCPFCIAAVDPLVFPFCIIHQGGTRMLFSLHHPMCNISCIYIDFFSDVKV